MVRLALVALLAAAPAAAVGPIAVAPSIPADSSGIMTPSVFEALHQIRKTAAQWTSVSMRIDTQGGTFLNITEPRMRLKLNGTKNGAYFNFSGHCGQDFISFSAAPLGNGGWSLYGSGVNVNLNPRGNGGYSAWGNVGARNFNLSIDRFGSSYTLWGLDGANLHISGFAHSLTVSGSIDQSRFDAKSLAILGAALAVASSPPSQTSVKK